MLKRLFIPTGIDTIALLGKAAKHADKYNYLLHYLISARAFDKRLTPESYIPLHSKIFEKYLTHRHAVNVVQFWLAQGVIEREPCSGKGYIVGKKSISYRFTPAYKSARVIDVGYLDSKFEEKVNKLTNEMSRGKLDMTVKANSFISFNLRELKIHAITAHQHLNELVASGAYALEKANLATVRVEAIRNEEWFCVRDTKGQRIHHNLCTLNRQLRQYCYLNTGEALVAIDVKNSQPVILAALLKDFFKNEIPEDVQHYIELCESGKFYEYLAQKFSVHINDDEARTKFKKKLFKAIFYGRNQAAEHYQEWHCFKAHFPAVAAFIINCKEKDYTALSIALQRLESEIVIAGVIGTIASTNNPEDFFALPLHDAIVTTSDKVAYVQDLLKKEFAKHGISPSFDTKSL